jgi:hypothetical protein
MAVTSDGGIVTVGDNIGGNFNLNGAPVANANTVTKYDGSGNKLWSYVLQIGGVNLGTIPVGIKEDTSGNIIISGMRKMTSGAYNTRTGFVAKLSASGSLIWLNDVVRYAVNTADISIAQADIDASGNSYVAVIGQPISTGGATGAYLLTINSSGAVTRTINISFTPTRLKLDVSGNILVSGWGTSPQPSLQKYSATGNLISSYTFDSANYIMHDFVVDASNIITAVGRNQASSTLSGFLTQFCE